MAVVVRVAISVALAVALAAPVAVAGIAAAAGRVSWIGRVAAAPVDSQVEAAVLAHAVNGVDRDAPRIYQRADGFVVAQVDGDAPPLVVDDQIARLGVRLVAREAAARHE